MSVNRINMVKFTCFFGFPPSQTVKRGGMGQTSKSNLDEEQEKKQAEELEKQAKEAEEALKVCLKYCKKKN